MPPIQPKGPAVGGDAQAQPFGPQVVTGLQGRPISTSHPPIGSSLVWNGTAWSPGPRYVKTTSAQIINTTSIIDLLNGEVTIAAGAMGVNGVLRLTAWGDHINNTGASQLTPSWVLSFGGSIFANTNVVNAWGSSGSRYPWRVVCEIINLNSPTSQWGQLLLNEALSLSAATWSGAFSGEGTYGVNQGGAVAVVGSSATVNTAIPQLLQLKAGLPVASASCDITLKGALVEIV